MYNLCRYRDFAKKKKRKDADIVLFWKSLWDRFHHNYMVRKAKTQAGRKDASLDKWRHKDLVWCPSGPKTQAEFLIILNRFHTDCIKTVKAKLMVMAEKYDNLPGMEEARAIVPFPVEEFDIDAEPGSIDGLIAAVMAESNNPDAMPSVLRCAKSLQDWEYDAELFKLWDDNASAFENALPSGRSQDSANVFPLTLRRAWAALEKSTTTIREEYLRMQKLEADKKQAAEEKRIAEEQAAEQKRLAEAAEALRKQKARELAAAKEASAKKKAQKAAADAEKKAVKAAEDAKEAAEKARQRADNATLKSKYIDEDMETSRNNTSKAVANVSPTKLPKEKKKGRKRKTMARAVSSNGHSRTFMSEVILL